MALHRSGDLIAAEAIYRNLIEENPHNPDALHLLGVCAAESGNEHAGAALIAAAIRQSPHPSFCMNLGVIYARQRKWKEAAICFSQTIEIDPSNSQAFWRLGQAYRELGLTAEARDACEEALRLCPSSPAAHFELALSYYAANECETALRHVLDAAQNDPESAVYRLWLGNVQHRLSFEQEAIQSYEAAASLDSSSAEAVYNLGVVLTGVGRTREAMDAYREALKRDPSHPRAWNNLGILLQSGGCLIEARECYGKAMERDRTFLEARYNFGLALQESDEPVAAEAEYREVLAADPNHAEAGANLGNLLLASGKPVEALRCYEQVISAHPENAEAQWNAGVVRLLLGDYQRGWEGYEWRFKQREAKPRHFDRPLWDGSDCDGATILIHTEQGFGDAIQFIRYAKAVAERGGRVVVECQEALRGILRTAPGVHRVVARGQESIPHDWHIPLMSLPRVFATTLETIPGDVPYIAAPEIPPPEEMLRASGLRVGVAWAGNPNHKNDRNRSMAPAELTILAAVPGVKWFSLQKDAAAPGSFPAVDLSAYMGDWSATAALVRRLDLVVAVDTAVAHLSGALGGTVWTLLPFVPDWRWGLVGDRTPWYPTMQLFRQETPGDWRAVLKRVADQLSRLAESKR